MTKSLNSVVSRFFISLFIGVISYPAVALIRGYDLSETSGYYYFGFLGYATLALFLIFETQNFKSKFLQTGLSWKDNFQKRLWTEIGSTLILTPLILNPVYLLFFLTFFYGMTVSLPSWWFYNIIGMLLSFLFLFFVNLGFFIEEWQNSLLKNEILEKEGIRARLEVLQSQISPHFLFNNFNILNALIDVEPKLAQQYLQKLSDVFRYVLKNHQDETVTLTEELKFITDYLFLLKIRFSENFYVEMNIADDCLLFHLPPATLQLLVENAVKHNELSKRNPLTIRIYTTHNQSLVVENNLQLKQSVEPGESTKTGLSNISERYHFLTKRKIEISENGKLFSVTIPLLEVEEP